MTIIWRIAWCNRRSSVVYKCKISHPLYPLSLQFWTTNLFKPCDNLNVSVIQYFSVYLHVQSYNVMFWYFRLMKFYVLLVLWMRKYRNHWVTGSCGNCSPRVRALQYPRPHLPTEDANIPSSVSYTERCSLTNGVSASRLSRVECTVVTEMEFKHWSRKGQPVFHSLCHLKYPICSTHSVFYQSFTACFTRRHIAIQ
jgi:hypothetical protein